MGKQKWNVVYGERGLNEGRWSLMGECKIYISAVGSSGGACNKNFRPHLTSLGAGKKKER